MFKVCKFEITEYVEMSVNMEKEIILNVENNDIEYIEILFEYKFIKELRKKIEYLKEHILKNKVECFSFLDLYISFKNKVDIKSDENIRLIFEEPIFSENFTKFLKIVTYGYKNEELYNKQEYMNFIDYLNENYKLTDSFNKYSDLYEQIYYFHLDLSCNRLRKKLIIKFREEYESLNEIKRHYHIMRLFHLKNINIDYYNLKNSIDCINSINLEKVENYLKDLLLEYKK